MTIRGNVAVRVDANPRVGLGHVKRCLTLVKQLRADAFDVRLVGRYSKETRPLINGVPVSCLENPETVVNQTPALEDEASDAHATLSLIGRYPAGSSWVIVDHYGLGEHWERIVRESGHAIAALDDFRHRSHCADLLISDVNTK